MTASGSSPRGADHPVGERPAPEPEFTDADRIRAAVLDCPDVADLSAGPSGDVASYLPGRSMSGVRVDDDHVEIHIVAHYGRSLQAVADEIGESVTELLDGRPLSERQPCAATTHPSVRRAAPSMPAANVAAVTEAGIVLAVCGGRADLTDRTDRDRGVLPRSTG